MKNTTIFLLVAVLAGGANASGLDSLAVNAAELKAAAYAPERHVPAPAAVPAARASVKTTISCRRDDADAWVEVGIAPNGGQVFRAYVVFHNVDAETSKLVVDRQVLSRTEGRETFYEAPAGTLGLRVSRNEQGRLTGDFTMMYDGPNGPTPIEEKDLLCTEKTTISFD